MDKEIPKIECKTEISYRNKKTGKVSKEKIEGPDIVEDVTVTVTNKGLEVLQNLMKK